MQTSFELKVVGDEPDTPEEMKPLVDCEIGIVNTWIVAEGSERLTRYEEGILRTYLVQKYRGRLNGEK